MFDEDSSDESYDLPFSAPEDLQAHFIELEENSLSLIQQCSENEQQTELKRKEYERIKKEKTMEIRALA